MTIDKLLEYLHEYKESFLEMQKRTYITAGKKS